MHYTVEGLQVEFAFDLPVKSVTGYKLLNGVYIV